MKSNWMKALACIVVILFLLAGGVPAAAHSGGSLASDPADRPREPEVLVKRILLPIVMKGGQSVNHPPSLPSNPKPANAVNGQSVVVTLGWSGDDPDGDVVSYDVYFEASDDTPDVLISDNQMAQSLNPGVLAASTTYYWQVIATDEHGLSTSGSVWHFTTAAAPHANAAPNEPATPNPADTASGQATVITLSWSGGDPDGDSVAYDVYFEARDTTPDVLISDNQTAQSLDPGILSTSTTYYWQIIATDEHGLSTTGPVWHFTTAAAPPANQPPHPPSNPSPANGSVSQSLLSGLTWYGGDPDFDSVTYDVYFAAGDPTPDLLVSDNQAGLSYYPAGLAYNTTYYWQIMATDEHGLSTTGPVWRFTTTAVTPDQRAGSVAPGVDHNCVLTAGGGVKCWGRNTFGQLGDGTFTDSSTPVYVSGLASGVTAITTGYNHTCAITAGGGVKCWGANSFGQLGNNSTVHSNVPVNVTGLGSDVAAIDAGAFHSCALMTGGGVLCWGHNALGQLGDGTTSQQTTPVDVSGLSSGITGISAGGLSTCAVTETGGALCWGGNNQGQLGDGTTTNNSLPVSVSGLTGVVQVDVGAFHACAATTDEAVWCWGDDDFSQLGDSAASNYSTTPVAVSGLANGASAIALGDDHACALKDGSVACWGRNDFGQLGDGIFTDSPTALPVIHLAGAETIAAGRYVTCARLEGGAVQCWGINGFYQLGDGTTTNRPAPVYATGFNQGTAGISAGTDHTCALTESGRVRCWGSNTNGQLGDGTYLDQMIPVPVTGLTDVAGISAGLIHTCALTASGGVKCWGNNNSGQLGDGTATNQNTPVDVYGLTSGVMAIATNGVHTCALVEGGGVKCWGNNSLGQLGDGTTIDSYTPVDVSGLTRVIAITAGAAHTCALNESGGVKCWGYNQYGALGDGSNIQRNTPVDVSGLTSGVKAIAAGAYHTCALTESGGGKCWGYNNNYELGDGTNTVRTTPVDVWGLGSGVVAITSRGSHTCALTISGGVKCWGTNGLGQFGDGTTDQSPTPVDVSGLTSGGVLVSAGGSHTCGLNSNGTLKCWGYNAGGQLGDGTIIDRLTPTPVCGFSSE